MNELIGSVAIGVYSALTDALGPELTRRANASLREALADGAYDPMAAAILDALCHDDDIASPVRKPIEATA